MWLEIGLCEGLGGNRELLGLGGVHDVMLDVISAFDL